VLQALLASRGRLAAVLCSEGRPGGEGLRLARELARARLPVQLLTDAALFGRLEEVDLVVVGADALLSQAVVNKVGTCPLAILARQAGRPFFVLAERDKILPAGLERFFRLPARSLFDRTPYRLVSGIVCEFGVLGRTELAREMRRARVSPALVRALRRSSI
jgi:translation initiation factor eIF-2B subunit delta